LYKTWSNRRVKISYKSNHKAIWRTCPYCVVRQHWTLAISQTSMHAARQWIIVGIYWRDTVTNNCSSNCAATVGRHC